MTELLVTIVLMGVIGVMAGNFLYSTTALSDRATKNVTAEREAMIALRRVTQDVRAANPLGSTYPTSGTCPAGSYPTGYDNCLSFVISRPVAGGGDPTCTAPDGSAVIAPYTQVTYALKNGGLFQDRVTYNASCAVVSASTGGQVIGKVINTSSQPLFSYFSKAGGPMPTTSSVVTAGSVRINLILSYGTGTPPLRLSSVAALRNSR